MTEEIITDYRQTVQRLQEELKEKSDMIFKLMDYVARLEQETKGLKELNKKICEDWEKEIKFYWNTLEEIREVIYYCGYRDVVDKVLPKINEVLNKG